MRACLAAEMVQIDGAREARRGARGGQILPPRYRLVERIATGGVAAVWRGWDSSRRTPVAVKLPLPHCPEGDWRIRHLRREAEAASVLAHPALARLLACGEEAGRPWLVYEYLPGLSLARAFAGGRLHLRALLRALRQAADGLAHLHARDWVHGDVKPANILFDARGKARLIDFGLTGPRGRSTRENGQVVASIAYAAPEQTAGRALEPASDVYSLCAVLYEGVTGVPYRPEEFPAPGESRAGCWLLRAELPRELDEMFARGLAPEPRERYRDAAALSRALSACLRAPLPRMVVGRPARPRAMDAPTAPGFSKCG